MPRRKILKTNKYQEYNLNEKYHYDKKQLDEIIKILKFHNELGRSDIHSNYMAFSMNIYIKNGIYDVKYDPSINDDGGSQPPFKMSSKEIKSIFPRDKYCYFWTREYKQDYAEGEHYHIMVIANNTTVTECFKMRDELNKIKNVSRAFFAPRYNTDGSKYFHYLNGCDNSADGLHDAVARYCYYTKIEQKLNLSLRGFGHCLKLEKLSPIKPFDSNQYRLNKKYEQKHMNIEIILPSRCKFGKSIKTTSTRKNKPLII